MELNHPKGVHPAHLLTELAEKEEEEGLVLLSQKWKRLEEVEREASEAGILVITVHHNFYLTLLLLHFSKKVSLWHQSPFYLLL